MRGQAATECRCGATAGSLRGQAAIEVMAYAGFFMLVFAAGLSVFLQLQNQELSRAEGAYAQQIAYQLADQIATAFIAGPGFSERVQLAPDLLGKPYILEVSCGCNPGVQQTGFVYVEWAQRPGPYGSNPTVSAPTITSHYTADTYSKFITSSGDYIVVNASAGQWLNISNVDGKIHFSRG